MRTGVTIRTKNPTTYTDTTYTVATWVNGDLYQMSAIPHAGDAGRRVWALDLALVVGADDIHPIIDGNVHPYNSDDEYFDTPAACLRSGFEFALEQANIIQEVPYGESLEHRYRTRRTRQASIRLPDRRTNLRSPRPV
jgi:hypothetical protein